MNRNVIPLALGASLVLGGCGYYGAWQQRREARALEQKIEKQNEALKRMSAAELENKEAESREKAIAQYEKILNEYGDVGKDQSDESLYLLGRLLFEREQQAFQRGQQSYESDRLSAEAAGRRIGPEPKPRYPQSKAVFQRLLKEFPDSQFREDALYDLGYILTEEGDRAAGAELFQTLVREKPKGRYSAEVHFRLGEAAFDAFRLADAETHYRAVVAGGPEDLQDKALFKLGWVYYNLDQYDSAKQVLASLIRRQSAKMEKEGREFAPAPILFFPGPRRASMQAVQEKEIQGADLYQETLEIIARVHTDSGGADSLVAFLKGESRGKGFPRYAGPLLHRLALVQKERSLFDDAAHSYEALLATFPTYRDAPVIELELVDVLVNEKDMDRAARVREGMLAKYDVGSPWARANPEQEVRDAALKAARKGLAWAIRYHHSRGLEQQKSSGEGSVPPDLGRAIALYERYLKRFPEGKASYTKRFRYAQALYAAGEYARAADTFRIVSQDEKYDQRRETAAFSRVLSVEKLVEGRQPPLPKPTIDQLVAAYEDYIKLNPASDKNAALLFKEGSLYFAAESYPAAIGAFERLIQRHGSDPLAAEANDLLAQAHFRLGEFAVAERWSEKALAASTSDPALAKRRDEVENLYALSMFKQAEKAEEEKKYGDATRDYLRLVDRLPGNEIAAKALYNAGTATERAGKKQEATQYFERLLDSYPSSELAPDAAVRLAEFYKDEATGSERIMRVYERAADSHVESPKGEEFLFLAGKLAARDKRPSDTIRLFEKFLSRYRSQAADLRGERNTEALYHLGVTYAAAGNAEAARQNLEQFLARPRSAKASFGEGEGFAYAEANANLLLANMLAREYRGIRIEPPIADNLKRKESLLNGVVDRYAPAVASGLSPIATEASFGIGSAYEEFAVALESAPRPPGLTADEQREYDRLLAEKTRPFFRKAVEAYRVGVRASREKSIDDEWVNRSRGRLAALGPKAFLRDPRPAFLRLPETAGPGLEPLRTYGGKTIAAGSGPGLFGSMFASDDEKREAAFAEGLAALAESPPDWEEARTAFAEAAAGGPPEAGVNLAVAQARSGQAAQAAATIEDVTRRHPDFAPATSIAARIEEQAGRKSVAESFYRKAAEAPAATDAEKVAYAEFLEAQGKPAEALALYQAVVAANPGHGTAALAVSRLQGGGEGEPPAISLTGSPALLVEAGILAAERDDHRGAMRAFTAAQGSIPSSDRSALAVVLNDQAIAAIAAGDLAGAASLVASARQASPSSAEIANTAGMLAMQRGDFPGAEKEFRAALAANPSAGAPWANLGILNELYFGNPDQAVECYNRYLATKPKDEAVVAGWVREIREGGNARNESI